MAELSDLSEKVAKHLLDKQMLLATAESCSGGWVAKCLTDVAGSSGWFERGFVTYSNAAKQEMLGVPAALLATHGAVSEAVAQAMAQGALAHSHANVALAISGIAGPGGAVPGKPVGTVCFAWCVEDGRIRVETVHFAGDRSAVRRQSVAHALNGLLDLLLHA
jgi:nicotinamide-nucleotide amidase